MYRQRVLPFGSKASVTAFISAAFAFSRIDRIWSSYFGDFLHVCSESEHRHLDIAVSLFLKLHGWRVSEDKLVPYSALLHVLQGFGNHFGFGRSQEGPCAHEESGVVAPRGCGSPGEAARAREHIPCRRRTAQGTTSVASGQLFGRMARQALHQLVFRGGESKPPESRGVWGVTRLLELLKDGLPREVSNCETVICELEALAVVLALKTFEGELHNRSRVIFTDNSGVHGSFVHCWSDNPVGNALAHAAALKEFELHAFLTVTA